MKIKTLILILIICLAIAGCNKAIDINDFTATQEASKSATQTPNPTIVSPSSTPTKEPTPETTPSPVIYEPLPAPDTSYVDDSIRPAYIVFDDDYMYYIDGMVIKKRHMQTGDETIIFEGVYDNEYLSIQDGWLYFYTRGKGIVKVKTDGTRMEVIRNIQASKVMVVEDKLYFLFNSLPWFGGSLYKYDMSTKEFRNLYDIVWYMSNKDNIIYFCRPVSDGLIFGHYDTKTNMYITDISHHIWYPSYIDAIEIYYDYDKDIYQYYNYLIYEYYINDEIYLNAYDMKTKNSYTLVKWDYEHTLDMVVYRDEIYIVANQEYNYLAEEPNSLIKFSIKDGRAVIETISNVNLNKNYIVKDPKFIDLSELPINKNWDKAEIINYWKPILYNKFYYYVDWDMDYNFRTNENNNTHIFKSKDKYGKNQEIVLPNVYASEDYSFCLYQDTIYYYKEPLPILCSYNIITGETKEYGELMAYPSYTKQYYQYLIFDSFYNGYDYVDAEDSIYKGQCIAFNMETGEIIQVENDLIE